MMPIPDPPLAAAGPPSPILVSDPSRGVGWSVIGDVSVWVTILFGVITQLGDPWFLFVFVAVVYWIDPAEIAGDGRRNGALLVALGIGAVAVTTGLKAAFALPRPPGVETIPLPEWMPVLLRPVYRNVTTGAGFGFPSGHAIGATVIYGGAALLFDVWNRWRRVAAASVLIALVCLSRIVLGVHYFVDVLVGVGVGLAALVLATTRPDRAFALAGLVGGLALVYALLQGYADPAREAAAALGAGFGGALAWRAVGPTESPVSLPVAAVGLVATGGLWVVTYALSPPLPVVAVVDGIALAGVVALPALAGRS